MSRNVDLSLVAEYTMLSGIGNLDTHTACVVSQAAILDALDKGQEIKELTDRLECACPVLRVLAIALNDTGWWVSDEVRTVTLRPLIPLLLDSRRTPDVTAQRAAKAATFAKYAAKHAADSAKYAAKYADSAAKSAAESAKYAADFAEYAADFAKHAGEYAKYAADFAESAPHFAKYAAKSAADSAKYAAESAADFAKYAPKYTELTSLRSELLRVWLECEAIQ